MKNYSSFYIFIYASVMVIIVAAILSFTAIQLKPMQQKNIENKKMQDILASVNIESTAENADELYNKYITDSYVININGEEVSGKEAFKVNLKKELSKDTEEMNLPVYICSTEKDGKCFIVPVRGKGLGGPIWGYIAFRSNLNTIVGTTFDHDAETPGLGDKITTKEFQTQFRDKKIFDDAGGFVSISVLKGGKGAGNPHAVDAISGGTITSNGVNAMLEECLVNYETFFKSKGN